MRPWLLSIGQWFEHYRMDALGSGMARDLQIDGLPPDGRRENLPREKLLKPENIEVITDLYQGFLAKLWPNLEDTQKQQARKILDCIGKGKLS